MYAKLRCKRRPTSTHELNAYLARGTVWNSISGVGIENKEARIPLTQFGYLVIKVEHQAGWDIAATGDRQCGAGESLWLLDPQY